MRKEKLILKGNEIYCYSVCYGLDDLNAKYWIERIIPSENRNIISSMSIEGEIKRFGEGKALFRPYSKAELKGNPYWVNINNLRATKRRRR